MGFCCLLCADRSLFPRLGDDDSSSGDDTRGTLWGLAPIHESTAPMSFRGSASLGRTGAGAGGPGAPHRPVPTTSTSTLFARDNRPAWVSAALLVSCFEMGGVQGCSAAQVSRCVFLVFLVFA